MTAQDIIKKYPELFGEPPYDPKETLICFGFEVSNAWLPILEKGFREMAKIVKRDEFTDFKVIQVKEKFGGLRVYTNYYTDEIDKIIDRMEEQCAHTCEQCGSSEGKLRQDGWWQTLCDDCYNKKFE
jgi:ribosomal protein L37AE/L43A